MKTLITALIVITGFSSCFSQKQIYNWYFGGHAGITFNTKDGIPKVLTDGALLTWEGCSSISDKQGNLLFYTDGVKVWNRFHDKMPSGDSLAGSITSTQSALIIPKPGDTNVYYIFTTDQGGYNPGPAFGMNYSVVDITADSGRGDVAQKNLFLFSPSTEKLAAVRHANNHDIWVIGHEFETNRFRAYLVTDSGISPVTAVSRVGSVHVDPTSNTIGQMKVSPDGTKIALAIYNQKAIELFDFNSSTGVVSKPLQIKSDKFSILYGVEFSSNSNKLYVTGVDNSSKIWQFDLAAGTSTDIINSETTIAVDPDFQSFGSLQLGPDGKIYVARYTKKYLGVINSPDISGTACNFVDAQVDLKDNVCFLGLPDFLMNYYRECGQGGFDYPNFISTVNMKLSGDAAYLQKFVRLTPSKNFKAGAMWYDSAIDIKSGFTLTFRFRASEASNDGFDDGSLPGADGIAVVFRKPGSSELGKTGGGIGYDGIPNSLAIEFDMYKNTQMDGIIDPNGNHLAVQSNGAAPNSANHYSQAKLVLNDSILIIRSDSTIYNVRIDYNLSPKKLSVYLNDLNLFMKPDIEIDSLDLENLLQLIDSKVIIGITSATGNARQAHDILNWSLCTKPKPFVNDVAEENFEIKNDEILVISPNPAESNATISIISKNDGTTDIKLYNSFGEEVLTIINHYLKSGVHKFNLDCSHLENGIYFIKYQSGNAVEIQKFIVIK